jgi:hypothetical protein
VVKNVVSKNLEVMLPFIFLWLLSVVNFVLLPL